MDEGCPSAERLAAVANGQAAPDIATHAETCARCRAVLVALLRGEPASSTVAPAIGTVVGRYVIEEWLGAGGMGVVYAARDPKLQRGVALKLLRPSRGAAVTTDRLEREARAAAAVAHPNVVTVFDVGRHDDQVFVAMERIRGVTLRGWLEAARPWPEVLGRLLEVARGIAAVHAAGFIHRDIKPDNVLVGDDGRARITDFGLARMTMDAALEPPAEARAHGETSTRTGAFVGTPAYAAPEQLAGAEVDARADQYAFAVTAWEALHGSRPVADVPAAAAQTASPDIPPARSPRRGVPRAIERVLLRALAQEAAARFASMTALVEALEAVLRTRKRAWLAGGAIALVGISAGIVVAARGAPAATCDGVAAELAGVWDEPRAAELVTHFTATGHPKAAQRYAVVRRILDRYAGGWTNARRQFCEAARPDEPYRRCLDDRRDALQGLISELARGDAALVDRAIDGARMLPSIERCRGVTATRSTEALAIERELATIPQAIMLHGASAARQMLERLRSRAAALVDPALDAELQLVSARVALADGEHARAADELRHAIANAERGRDDRTRAAAAIALVDVAIELRSLDEATRMVELADAIVVRIGGDREPTLGLLAARARLATARGRAADALPLLAKALAILEETERDSLLTASLLYDRYSALLALERRDEADEVWRRATAIVVAHYGDTDEASAMQLVSEAQLAINAGEPRRCAEVAERALAALAAARGVADPELANVRLILFAAYSMLGEWTRARDHMRAAVAHARANGREAEEASMLEHLGRASLGVRDPSGAVDAYRASTTLAEQLGAHEQRVFARYGLGRALVALAGEPSTADAAAADHEAIVHLEWVLLRLDELAEPPKNVIGMTHAALADALWRRNGIGDRDRARASAATAHAMMTAHRDRFSADGGLHRWLRRATEVEIAAIEAWQVKRRD